MIHFKTVLLMKASFFYFFLFCSLTSKAYKKRSNFCLPQFKLGSVLLDAVKEPSEAVREVLIHILQQGNALQRHNHNLREENHRLLQEHQRITEE